MNYELHNGDCLEVMRAMDESSVGAIVTDPPYGLSFMGKGWDHAVPGSEFWAEALRVAKPGAHLVAFGGTRLYHRLTCAIEDAGWEVRDCLMWLYGSGFPKSHDVSKAIDREAGAEREVVGINKDYLRRKPNGMKTGGSTAYGYSQHQQETDARITAPATDAAKRWQGWGTALKPAWEPIVLARKPLAGTVASNVLEHGTGGINVDGCRVGTEDVSSSAIRKPGTLRHGGTNYRPHHDGESLPSTHGSTCGRWPANLILDAEAGAALDGQFAGASRYFYCPKASKADRDEGLDGVEPVHRVNGNKWTGQDYRVTRGERPASAESGPRRNVHPTVKPTELMRYLCRLVTPPGAKILDPFMGSGSTGKAAAIEGFDFIGIDLDPHYCDIARKRIEHARTEAGPYTATA